MGGKGHRVIVEVFSRIFVYFEEFVVVRISACSNTVGDIFDKGYFIICHGCIDICSRISQHKFNILESVVEITVCSVLSAYFHDIPVIIDDIVVAKNVHLAVGDANFHILIEYAAALVIQNSCPERVRASSEVKIVVSVRDVKKIHIKTI